MPNFSTVCVDANLVIRLVDESESVQVENLFADWYRQGQTIVAPYLLRYEVTNIVRQMTRHGMMSESIAEETIQAAIQLPIHLYTKVEDHAHALEISQRFNLSATYDAHYLALADSLGCEFWTADKRLARAAQPELDWVHLLDA